MQPRLIFPTEYEVSRVFTPASPVSIADLFAGRLKQMRRTVGAINQIGQHAAVFGERGVGKTSLVNVFAASYQGSNGNYLIPRVNCDGSDDFDSLWRKVYDRLQDRFEEPVSDEDELPSYASEFYQALETAGENITPGSVTRFLTRLSRLAGVVVIFDEFDRLEDGGATREMADTIKAISDQGVEATIVVVGVADDVMGLIKEHESIERNLVQIPMPRMSDDELIEIVHKGLGKLGMTSRASASRRIACLSRGLPHYTHLLGKHATLNAIYRKSNRLEDEDVEAAVGFSIEDVTLSVRNAYYAATFSAHTDTIYAQVLAACALAKSNELGWFTASSVREPLSRIMGSKYEIQRFARHLGAFCEETRGPVLQREGKSHSYKYRFRNPLMQPFAIIKVLAEDMVKGNIDDLLRHS